MNETRMVKTSRQVTRATRAAAAPRGAVNQPRLPTGIRLPMQPRLGRTVQPSAQPNGDPAEITLWGDA